MSEKPDKKKKGLAGDLLDDDFFQPPVESELEDIDLSQGGRGGAVSQSRGKRSIVRALALALLGLGAAGAGVYYQLFMTNAVVDPAPSSPDLSTQRAVAPAKPVTSAPSNPGSTAGKDAPPASPASQPKEERPEKAEPKTETHYGLKVGPFPENSPDIEKFNEQIEILGLRFEAKEDIRPKNVYKLYLERTFSTRREAAQKIDEITVEGVQPEIVKIKGKPSIRLGSYQDEKRLRAIASEVEALLGLNTIMTSQVLEEKWRYYLLSVSKPIKQKKDAEVIADLLLDGGFPVAIVQSEVAIQR